MGGTKEVGAPTDQLRVWICALSLTPALGRSLCMGLEQGVQGAPLKQEPSMWLRSGIPIYCIQVLTHYFRNSWPGLNNKGKLHCFNTHSFAWINPTMPYTGAGLGEYR